MIDINNDRIENIKLFENIEKQDTFSKYTDELNRIFGDRSFDRFYDNLISNRRIYDDIFFQMFDKTHRIKKFNNFDIKKYKHFITELKQEEKKEEEKRKNFRNQFKFKKREIKDYSVKSYDSDKKSNSKDKKFGPIADIGRYNPNYNSIRKNEPKIFISKNGFIPNIKLKDNLSKRKKIFFSSPSEPNIIKTDNNNINNNKQENKILNKRQRNNSEVLLTTQNSKFKNSFLNMNKTNHALRFSKYTNRKPLIIDSNNNFSDSNNHIINSKSQNNIKGLIEFNKMSSNLKMNSYIVNNEEIPPLGAYEPKYDYIRTKSPDCFISKKPIIQKQIKLKKILCEYNVPLEYKLITNLNLKNT